MAPLSPPGDLDASLVCSGNTLPQNTDFTAPQVMLPYTGSRHWECVSAQQEGDMMGVCRLLRTP